MSSRARRMLTAFALLFCGCATPARGGQEQTTGYGTVVQTPSYRACLRRVPPELDIPQTMEAMVHGVLKGGFDHFPALTKDAGRPIAEALDGHRAICELYSSMGLAINGFTESEGHFIYSVRRPKTRLDYLQIIYVKVGQKTFRHFWPR